MIDYAAAPGNYKYHSIDDLERLKLQLEAEIKGLKGTTDRSTESLLKEDERMLHEVECEILERTLLQRGNDGGASS
jgi:hypothetical protein